MFPVSAKQRRLRSVGAAVLGVVLALVVWNVVAGLTLWRTTGYVSDPELGRIRKSGLYVHGIEGFSWSHINSLGMRGEEIGSKQPGETRVLFLGDSFTEAFQVPGDDTFVEIVGDELGSDGYQVHVINAGRSGASPADYIALAPWFAERIAPDVTVIQLSDQDFTDDLTGQGERNFRIEKTGGGFSAVLDPEFRSATPLVQRYPGLSPLLQIPLVRLAGENLSRTLSERGEAPEAGEPTSSSAVTVSPTYDAELLAWVLDELANRYQHLVILYVPDISFSDDRGLRTSEVEAALESGARERGIAFASPRDDFVASFERDHRAPTGFANSRPGTGHLNVVGHALIARRLVPLIEAEVVR